jgi:hypothetical protein
MRLATQADARHLATFRLAQETHAPIMVKLVHRKEVVILKIDEIREVGKSDDQGEYSRWLIFSTVIRTNKHYRRFYTGEVQSVKLLTGAEVQALS